MQQNNPVAFTIKSKNGLSNVLVSTVQIVVPGSNKSCEVNAIWDTGASGSVITSDVAKALGLIPTGMAQVHTANGKATQNTYTIHIGLPNKVLIQDIIATECNALS